MQASMASVVTLPGWPAGFSKVGFFFCTEEFVGLNVQHVISADKAHPTTAKPAASLSGPISTTVFGNSTSRGEGHAESRIPDTPISYTTCRHMCKDKSKCKHQCCKPGRAVAAQRARVKKARMDVPEDAPRRIPDAVNPDSREGREWHEWLSKYRLQPQIAAPGGMSGVTVYKAAPLDEPDRPTITFTACEAAKRDNRMRLMESFRQAVHEALYDKS